MERRQPRLAERTRRGLVEPGVLLAVTIRRDGTARLSPVEPFLLDAKLWLSMLWGSYKARDLMRDSRVLVHGIVTDRDGGDGEVKVRGTARLEGDVAVQRRYADAVGEALGWRPQAGRFHLFEVQIEHVASVRYDTGSGTSTSRPGRPRASSSGGAPRRVSPVSVCSAGPRGPAAARRSRAGRGARRPPSSGACAGCGRCRRRDRCGSAGAFRGRWSSPPDGPPGRGSRGSEPGSPSPPGPTG